MAEMNQFGSAQPGSAQTCSQCEALLMDVLDGAASAEDQQFFDAHVASCTGCSEMLADARRGGAWLEMLRHPRPEPPAALLERILLQTSGVVTVETAGAGFGGLQMAPPAAAPGVAVRPVESYSAAGVPAASVQGAGRKVLPFQVRGGVGGAMHRLGQTMLQPRLAMTAAMAFFSIALTLNLTGVHASALRMSDLRPTNLRREFYEANAHVVRYCDNLRVVYELEARTRDLQRTSDSESDSGSNNADTPAATRDDNHPDSRKGGSGSGGDQPADQHEQPKAAPKPGPGTSRRERATHDGIAVAGTTGHAGPDGGKAKFPTDLIAAMHLKGDPA